MALPSEIVLSFAMNREATMSTSAQTGARAADGNETMADEVMALMLGAELAQLLDEVVGADTQGLAPEDRDTLLARQMATAFGLPSLPTPPPRRYPMPLADELIGEMVERIVADWSPLTIILFGSRARGDNRLGSDVDLLVVLSHVDDKRAAAVDVAGSVATVPIAKDIFVTDPDRIAAEQDLIGGILYPALREGRVLYDARG